MSEPDTIDMMDEHELRTELRSVLSRLDSCQRGREEFAAVAEEAQQRWTNERTALEFRLDHIRRLVERDGYQAKNGGNGGRQFLEALQEALK